MKTLWPTIDSSAPGIARTARRYEMKLRKALGIAARRHSSRYPRLAELYAGAKVEGVDSKLRMKKATVIFSAPPFRGGLHQIYDWTNVEESAVLELAADIAWSLGESPRRPHRGK